MMVKQTDKELKEDIERVADYYGYDSRVNQTIEEMSELMQAFMKQRRYPEQEGRQAQVIEEIADVLVCIDQIIYLAGIDGEAIEGIKSAKMKRELSRIARSAGLKG